MFCFATFRAIHRKLEKTHYMLIRATGVSASPALYMLVSGHVLYEAVEELAARA